MNFKFSLKIFFLAFGFFAANLLAGNVNAQGVIVPVICDFRPCQPRPRPRPVPLPNALPVKSIRLDTKISGQAATTHIEQVFRNDTPYTLEGTYFFPIPETAAIVEFAIWENGKKLVGEVRSREEARKIYDEIVRRQRDPGLLEYAGKNLFQASIYPIAPNSDKKLELTYTEILKAESGTVAYRYPLGTGRNLWSRPQPVNSLDDVDFETKNFPGVNRPNNQKFGTITGKIEISGQQAIRNVYSPSHQIEVSRKGENSAVVKFETTTNDNDLELFYGFSNEDFGVSLMTYREAGKDGYFLMQISPKDNLSEQELADKDIVFVLDTSGSMADEGKLEKARAALLFGIKNLRAGDRFNVISFAGDEHLLESKMIAADAAGKKRGQDFVGKLKANGGTNINDALLAALKQFERSERPKMLVFMTDGLPTVGVSNADKIIQNAKESKVVDLRLFTFGVGYDVNTLLLDKLAAENSGAADYIQPKEDLEVKVSNFFTKVNSPVLTNLILDFDQIKTDSLYPRKLADIFKGTQLTLIGRYQNASDIENATIKLTGKTGRENRTFTYPHLNFPARGDQNDFLPRLWATRRVGWLVEQIRLNGENREVRDEIIELGTRYGIVTPYTSYLATDGSEREFRVDSNVPAARKSSSRASAKPAPMPISGQSAVQASLDSASQQNALSLADDADKESANRSLKKIGAKTFYLENGVWIDSEYREESKITEIKLKFASDEYFNLVGKERELAQFLSLGQQVTVVWKGKVYRIVN